MLRLRLAGGIAALTAGALLPVSAPAPVCAAEGPRAVLVIDTGAGEYRYCVALGEDEVSGIDVIRLAGEQHGLDYSLGYGGGAVCRLAGVGPDGDDCWAEYPYFWAYWQGDGSGGWRWSSTGAGSAVVEDGDVEGWSWGTGDDPSSHPPPPVTTYGEVCADVAATPAQDTSAPERKRPAPERRAEPQPAPAAPSPSVSDEAPAEDKRPRRRPPRSPAGHEQGTEASIPPPPPSAAPDLRAARGSRDGPPPGGLAALAITAAVVAAGAVLRRRGAGEG